MDRLVHSERPWLGSGAGLTHDYQLDGVGNREIGYVSGVMNEYEEIPGECREYGSNGNLIRTSDLPSACIQELAQFSFDYLDRLVQHDDPTTGDTLMLVYDAFGRRVAKESAAGVTRFSYSAGRVCEEQDVSGNVTTFVYGRGVDAVLQMQTETETYYYLSDDMGNVAELWHENGAADTLVESYDYDDYGQVIDPVSGVVLASPSGVGNPYFFTGRRFDSEMGLYYYRARYLDPVAGRFVNRDPIGMWGDAANVGNAYTYAASNPWTRTDPTGLSSGKSRMDLSFVHGSSGGSDSGRGGKRIGRGDGFLMPRGKVGIATPSSPYADLPKNDSSPSPLCSATSTAHSPPGGCNLPAVMVSDEQEGDGGSDGGASDPDHGGSTPPDDDDNRASGPGEYKGPTGPPPPGGGARPYIPGPTRPGPAPEGAVSGGTIFVDPEGNAFPTPDGGEISGSPDGSYIQVRDKDGKPTGVRKDGGHNPHTHKDPRAQKPHLHAPGETNPDGTPWLPLNEPKLQGFSGPTPMSTGQKWLVGGAVVAGLALAVLDGPFLPFGDALGVGLVAAAAGQ